MVRLTFGGAGEEGEGKGVGHCFGYMGVKGNEQPAGACFCLKRCLKLLMRSVHVRFSHETSLKYKIADK